MDEQLRSKIIFEKAITGVPLTKKELKYCEKQEHEYQKTLERLTHYYNERKESKEKTIDRVDYLTPNGYKLKSKISGEELTKELENNEGQWICFAIAIILLSMFAIWLVFFSGLTPYNLP